MHSQYPDILFPFALLTQSAHRCLFGPFYPRTASVSLGSICLNTVATLVDLCPNNL